MFFSSVECPQHLTSFFNFSPALFFTLNNQTIDLGDVFEKGRPLDPDFIGSGKQVQGEMNDFVFVDMDCFFCPNKNDMQSDEFILEQLCEPLPDESEFSRFMEGKDLIIKLGNGQFSGLELAIRFLSIGDCALLRCHSKYAHPNGRKNSCEEGKDLPSGTDVFYRIHVRSIISLGDAQSISFRLKLAKQLKMIGNDNYKYEWLGQNGGFGKMKSLKAYDDASQELISVMKDLEEENIDNGKSEEMKKDVSSLLGDCYNNIAAVHLRDKNYAKAKDFAGQAIQMDPKNIKAFCRAAKASMLSGAFEECKMALEAAMELDKSDKVVQNLEIEFQRRIKAYNKKEKQMYTKMMRKKERKLSKAECGRDEGGTAVDSSIETNLKDSIRDDAPMRSNFTASSEKTCEDNVQSEETSMRTKSSEKEIANPRVWSPLVFFIVALCCAFIFVGGLLKGSKANHSEL